MQRKDGGQAYAYVLAEHKSGPDRDTAFQVLRYLMRIWEKSWRDLVSEESALASLMILLRYVARAGQGVTRDDLRRVLSTTLPTEEETLMSTIAEQWIQEGKDQGRAEGVVRGQAQLLLRQLELRFGPVPEAYRARIDQADADTLLAWGERVVTAHSLADVLGEHP
jgi:hypothetical protein